MSPREQLAHLCEVYHAVAIEAEGGKYEWGTFKLASVSWDDLVAEMQRLRQVAVEAVLTKEDDKALHVGTSYIVEHDHYHIGQLVALRLVADTEWDSYSLYR
jgi:hypothetical protein